MLGQLLTMLSFSCTVFIIFAPWYDMFTPHMLHCMFLLSEFNAQLSEILHELWELDDNRLEAGKHYAIDLQGYTKSYRRQDWAKDPLFQFVHDEVFKRPTYKRYT